jgi:hypothetical protein
MRIGIDLDNTIISYDKAFQLAAKSKGLVAKDCNLNKKGIRNLIRQRENGELEWQKLQGYVYSEGLQNAKLFPGVFRFLWLCRERKFQVEVVSHKTEYGHFDQRKISIRDIATNFLATKSLISDVNPLLQKITYKSTKQEKIDYIKQRNFDYFVDDLEEIVNSKALEKQKTILFAEEYHEIKDSKKLYAQSWDEITQIILEGWNLNDVTKMFMSFDNQDVANIEKLQGRGNSAIYKFYLSNGQKVALKMYPSVSFHDRLKSEFEGTKIFQELAIKNTQIPRFFNKNLNVATYEWIEGDPVNQYGEKEIQSALSFLQELHNKSKSILFSDFTLAADSCLKGEDIEKQIIRRLNQLEIASKSNIDLDKFLNNDFKPLFNKIVIWSKEIWPSNESYEKALLRDKLELSPSDFGFHNSIRGNYNNLIFHDFEYLGWDDPVKLISDFSHHAAMNLTKQIEQSWFKGVSEIYGADLLERLIAAWPLYGLNWCLIILNEFKNDVWNRRCLANDTKRNNRQSHLSNQLTKAKIKLENIASTYNNKFYW